MVTSSEFNLAFEEEATRTRQLNATTPQAANHLAATRRGLESKIGWSLPDRFPAGRTG
jgi:hypothetical protein